MGRLMDIINNRKNNDTKSEVSNDTSIGSIKKYNRLWLNRVSNTTGFIPNSDDTRVDGIIDALNRRNGHCPCGGNGDQFLCPCVVMREKGICKCGLFNNVRPVEPRGSSGARIKQDE
jgi:ferredoxin-thioredoxin reductase catalytic subunit